MKSYTSYLHAVIDLHKRGFTEDLVVTGKNLFWIQQKILFNTTDCEVLEWHRFHLRGKKHYMVLALIQKSIGLKGIVIIRDSGLNQIATSSNNCSLSPVSKSNNEKMQLFAP